MRISNRMRTQWYHNIFFFGFQLMSMSLHEIGITESTPPHIARIGKFTSFKAI